MYSEVLEESLVEWMEEFRDSDAPWTLPANYNIRKPEVVRTDVDALIAATAGVATVFAALGQSYAVRAEDGTFIASLWAIGIVSAVWAGWLKRQMLVSDHDGYEETFASDPRKRLRNISIVLEAFLTVAVFIAFYEKFTGVNRVGMKEEEEEEEEEEGEKKTIKSIRQDSVTNSVLKGPEIVPLISIRGNALRSI
jgi:hypothetical protein